eukprot:3933831-Rhodomonas_salina.3
MPDATLREGKRTCPPHELESRYKCVHSYAQTTHKAGLRKESNPSLTYTGPSLVSVKHARSCCTPATRDSSHLPTPRASQRFPFGEQNRWRNASSRIRHASSGTGTVFPFAAVQKYSGTGTL